MKKIDEIRQRMKIRPYPDSWYGPDGELTESSRELIAFNAILADHDYEVTDAVKQACRNADIDPSKYFVSKCTRADMEPYSE